MQIKGVFRDTVELREAALGQAPKAFDAVDMVRAVGELIIRMTDPEMFLVPDIDQTVVAPPTVRVDDGLGSHATPNYGLQSTPGAVGDDLRVNAPVAFEDAEDDGFAARPATPLSANTTGTKVRFIHFDNTAERRCPLALVGDPPPDFQIDLVDRFARQTANFSRLTCRQIEHKITYDLASFSFVNFGTPIIPV